MPRNPEQKPTYLQDVIAPKETEKALEGFDLDREFGEGTREKLEQELGERIGKETRIWLDARDIVPYVVLFGRDPPLGYGDTTFLKKRIGKNIESVARPPKGHVGNGILARHHEYIYRVLFGERYLSEEEIEAFEKDLEQEINEKVLRIATTKDVDKVMQCYFSERAVEHRVVFGKVLWTNEQGIFMMKVLENEIRESIVRGKYGEAAQFAAHYRLLRAHDIKFIPGKGIEIIDTPPQGFTQTPIPPMPEERKF